MPVQTMPKMQAIGYIMYTLKVGRSVVMLAMDILEQRGTITFETSPLDARAQLISQKDIDKVIEFIRNNA